VASESETLALLKSGISNRSVGQTLMNDTSSRSHMAFLLTLYQNDLKEAHAKSGRIILIDLAGSEKTSKTGAEGRLLDEAKQINKSLLALGNVINALIENKITHIPYRDSKLTRLLQESLGGNSKTNLVIAVSQSEQNEHETLSSLRFGNRAKQIKNKPKVNREYTVAELLLLLEKAEKRIQELEQLLSEMSMKKGKPGKKDTHNWVDNLMDSDHPILETDHEQQK
jgi:kinesin family protein 5